MELHAQCVLCNSPAILFFKDYKCEHNESLNYEYDSNQINLQITQSLFRNVNVDLIHNSYQVKSWTKDSIKLAAALNSKKIKAYKICECGFQLKTSPLIFRSDGYVNSLDLEILSFKIHKNDNSYLKVSNDYKYKKTIVIDINVVPPYNTLTRGGYVELPLINFAKMDKKKILHKIKTLIMFS